MNKIKRRFFFSRKFEDILGKSQIGMDSKKFLVMNLSFSITVAFLFCSFGFLLWLTKRFPIYYFGIVFFVSFFIVFQLITLIPIFALKNKTVLLESDLLYSARHLLLKLESGSSLVNSLESVSTLNTKSSRYFKEITYDISLGVPLEDAIEKAIEFSPSKAYSKILEEINSSLKTGSNLQKSIRSTVDDITRLHLIQIQEYGKKLNPMSMFYMIIGTILPSLGTAMIVVASSLLPGALIIDLWVLMAIAFLVLVVQIFFILAFKSLKPMVME